MARKTKAERNPAHVTDWPVDDYPYVVHRQYVPKPKYFRSHKAAVAYLVGLVKDFEFDMKPFDRDVPDACLKVLKAIEAIGVDGGHVNEVIAPYTSTRFEAELVRRKAVTP